MKIEIGTIFEQETSDAILMDLKGNTEDVNPHTEHWIVEDITSNTYKLYNLDTGSKWNVKKENMEFYTKGNKKFDIKPLLKISKEIG